MGLFFMTYTFNLSYIILNYFKSSLNFSGKELKQILDNYYFTEIPCFQQYHVTLLTSTSRLVASVTGESSAG